MLALILLVSKTLFAISLVFKCTDIRKPEYLYTIKVSYAGNKATVEEYPRGILEWNYIIMSSASF